MSLRVGLVGCGAWGKFILRDLVTCGARVSVVERSEEKRQSALALGAASASEDIAQLRGLDGYVVATLSNTHATVIEQLLPFGKPIFVEKPLATDVSSARRVADMGRGRLFVMEKWRYHPGVEYIRKQIAAGALGEIRAVRSMRWSWGTTHPDANAIWHLIPHDLAITLHWLGRLPPLQSVVLTTPLAFDSGLIATLGGGSDPLVTIDMSLLSPAHRRCSIAVGSKASMELQDSYSTEIAVRRSPPGEHQAPVEMVPIAQDMPLLLEIQAFLDHLRGGPAPMTSADEDLQIVERLAEIEAMARAARAA